VEDFLEQVSGEPILMISAAIGVVLILFVVLVVIIANMRIKTYKDRYVNTRIDNVEKEKLVDSLEKELQEYRITNTRQKQELSQFDETKVRLAKTETRLADTQQELASVQKLQAQTQAQLENIQSMYATLQEEHANFKERFDVISEENSKLRVNNARLLMKLETEERFNVQQQKRVQKKENGGGE
jgi:uncharacterized protein (DUF3084 family)